MPISVVINDKESKINLRSNFGFYQIKLKMEKNKKLGDFFTLKQGTKPYGSKDNKETELLSKVKYDESWEKAINGRNLGRYKILFEDDFVQRSEDLHSCLPLNVVNGEKIYFQRMRKISLFPRLVASYDNENIHGLYTCSVIFKESKSDLNLKYALCLLNSLLVNLWYKYFDTDIEIKLISVKEIPIPDISAEQQLPFIAKADIMLATNKELQELKQQLLQLLQSNFPAVQVNKKLEQWPSLSFAGFLKELSKQKIKPALPQQAEWMNYFEEQRTKAATLQNTIAATDKEIDKMVYQLYGLTAEEIKIVEGNEKE